MRTMEALRQARDLIDLALRQEEMSRLWAPHGTLARIRDLQSLPREMFSKYEWAFINDVPSHNVLDAALTERQYHYAKKLLRDYEPML